MNRQQKEVQQQFLDNEKAVLKQLEKNYQDALDEINLKIEALLARQDADMQHVIYRIEYQKALKTQVQTALEQLHNQEFETLSGFLTGAYEDGFIGTMYDLQGQGVPLVFPIDQEQVIAAVQHETPLSSALYVELGHDIKDLSKKISTEISRGISTGAMYGEMARNIASYANIPKNRAMTIARTEAHRIQCAATANAQWKAKEKGADVVKQWDSSLDGRTRDTHRQLDGQIRELDEPFEVAGKKAMYPGAFGDPAEDCNCRCALLQRARWALDRDITKWANGEGLVEIKAKDYQSFKDEYFKKVDEAKRVRQGAQMMNEERNRSGPRVVRPGKAKATNKDGDEITFDIANAKNQERAEAGKKVLTQLSNEYDTYLTSVGIGAKNASGSVDSVDGRMLLNNWKPETYIHEFAHSLTTTDRIKLGFADDREIEFVNELKKIRKSYRAELYGNPKKGIRANPTIGISSYADDSIDEFFAEAFAQAKMTEMGMELPQSFGSNTKYSNQVLALVDKYFKKTPLENIGKSATIEADILIHKSLGAKGKNYDIRLPDGSKTHLTEGTRISNVKVIAGKGRDRQIDEIDILLDRYGGVETEWQKKKGFGYVDYQDESYRAELHWYEEPTAGRHDWKVKPDADGNWFYDED